MSTKAFMSPVGPEHCPRYGYPFQSAERALIEGGLDVRAEREVRAVLAETEPAWDAQYDRPAFVAVSICWPNWAGVMRNDERIALTTALAAFVESN